MLKKTYGRQGKKNLKWNLSDTSASDTWFFLLEYESALLGFNVNIIYLLIN